MRAEKSEQTRRALLEAGHAIVANDGVSKLTIDAVGRRAGYSKGAIFHHFPSKRALLGSLMRDAIKLFDREIETALGKDRTAGSYTRAYLGVTVAANVGTTIFNALHVITEFAQDPGLRSIFAGAVANWSSRIENDGLDPAEAQMIRLAVDGIWFNEAAGGLPVSPALRENVIEALIGRTRGSGPASRANGEDE